MSDSNEEIQQMEADLVIEIMDSLVTTNEIGNGAHEFFTHDDEFFVNLYSSQATLAENGAVIPDATYLIQFLITRLQP